MLSGGPASIIYDSSGNAVGVLLDGSVYRLAVDVRASPADPTLHILREILETLRNIEKHLSVVTDEDGDMRSDRDDYR